MALMRTVNSILSRLSRKPITPTGAKTVAHALLHCNIKDFWNDGGPKFARPLVLAVGRHEARNSDRRNDVGSAKRDLRPASHDGFGADRSGEREPRRTRSDGDRESVSVPGFRSVRGGSRQDRSSGCGPHDTCVAYAGSWGWLWPNDWMRMFEGNLATLAALAALPATALAPIHQQVVANERRLRDPKA